jgi:FkbM family methyltransferase
MLITILYGKMKYVDVTNKVFALADNTGNFTIPSNDCVRFSIFKEDPVFGTVKEIVIIKDGIIEIFDHTQSITINITDCVASSSQLQNIHKTLKFKHGSLSDEYPEQLLTVKYINPGDVVLELGANVGRNTMLIASLLDNQNNLVTLECDQTSVNCLQENRDINGFHFNIEPRALSKKPLIQKLWDTKPSDTVEEGWKRVDTITFTEIEKKYELKFNTIVADCEGALYEILKDDPDMLNNINTVIVENDYWDIEKKKFVDNVMLSKGLEVVHQESGGWGPCQAFFFEVWKRRSFGFIILRNVRNERTDKYWQESYNCIRSLYKHNKIVIIDDNSDPNFLASSPDDENLTIINSEYKGRGELLPYIYYIKNKWFDNAIILHDSVFIKSAINLEFKNYKFLWGFHGIGDHHESQELLLNSLENQDELRQFRQNQNWTGCFGCMMIINYSYLLAVHKRFNFFNLLDLIVNRDRRCAFERIIALTMQAYNKTVNDTLLGSIHSYSEWAYTFEEYEKDKRSNQVRLPLIKVWSGR